MAVEGRIYTAQFNAVAITAVQDLFEILGSADSVLRIREVHITQHTDAGDTESEQLMVSIRRVTGSPTAGSGGSTSTPVARNPGDPAFGGTVNVNNVTQLSGGTNVVWALEAFNVMAGLHYMPPEDAMLKIVGASRCVIELEEAPDDSITVDGYVVLEEID